MFFVEHFKELNMEVNLVLPWAPSVNQIWRSNGKGKWYMTKVAKDYKRIVWALVCQERAQHSFPKDQDIEVVMLAFPPDNRKRDLDNIAKLTFDALQDAKVFENDCQIKRIFMEMREKQEMGKILITIRKYQVE